MIEQGLRLEIRGRVQGVGYRWAMAERARALGLGGWVRNRRDGSVEALVCGSAEALAAIQAWARRGPDAARVDSVEAFETEDRCEGFEQRPTV